MLDWHSEIDLITKSNIFHTPNFTKPKSNIILYGAGSMGEMALDLMATVGKKPKYIIDKNFTGPLREIPVIKPEKIPESDLKYCSFVICISSIPTASIFDDLEKLGCQDIRHFYDYSEITFPGSMPNGWFLKNLKKIELEGIEKVCKILSHDNSSLAHYLQFTWWRLKRKEVVFNDYPVLSGEKFFKAPHFPRLNEHETFVDGGAHFGKSIDAFIASTGNKFNSIWAFEPDQKNFEILKNHINSTDNRIFVHAYALYDQDKTVHFQSDLGFASKIRTGGRKLVRAITLDSMFNIHPSIIKLHIEGSELQALHGSQKTIKLHRPIMMVLADHHKDGLYKIATFLVATKNYKLYFSLHDYCGNSAVFYAYPLERLAKTQKMSI